MSALHSCASASYGLLQDNDTLSPPWDALLPVIRPSPPGRPGDRELKIGASYQRAIDCPRPGCRRLRRLAELYR